VVDAVLASRAEHARSIGQLLIRRLTPERTIDLNKDYRPRTTKRETPEPTLPWVRVSGMS